MKPRRREVKNKPTLTQYRGPEFWITEKVVDGYIHVTFHVTVTSPTGERYDAEIPMKFHTEETVQS